MAIQELLVKLTADNKDLKSKLKQSEADTKGFGNTVAKIGTMAVAAFAVAGAAVMAFGVASFKAWEQQDKANKKLQASLKGNVTAFKELEAQSGRLQQQSGFGDELLMDIQSLAASSGKSTAEIKKLTEATAYLAKATGQDLRSAYLQVNGTLTGSAGRLGRLDAEFLTLTSDQLKHGDGIDLVITKYKNLAIASTTASERVSNNWGDVKENLGKITAPAINGLLESINTNLLLINDTSMSLGEKLRWAFSTEKPDKYNLSLKSVGETATELYRNLLGITTVSNAMNGISGSITVLDGPTITPQGSKENQAKKAEAAKKAAEAAAEAKAIEEQALYTANLAASALSITYGDLNGNMSDMTSQSFEAGNAMLTYRDSITGTAEAAKALTENLDDMAQAQIAGNVAADMFTQLVDQNITDVNELGKAVYNNSRQIIAGYLSEAIAGAVKSALVGLPFPANIIAAGVAGAGAAGLFNMLVPKLAEGGVAYGNSIVNVGEYANARSNPEVIAPLDKLKSIMGGQVQRVEVYGYIDGDVIRLANKRSEHIAIRRG